LSVLPAIAWTWLTFSGTYAVANVVRSICTVRQLPPAVYDAWTPRLVDGGKTEWKKPWNIENLGISMGIS
jgi:hypothetical protein